MKHRRMLIAIASFALVIISGLVGAPSASAAGACQAANYGNWFDGYAFNPSAHRDNNFIGASGYITIRPLYTCSGDSRGPDPSTRNRGYNFTTNWVMIADYNSLGWSQAGEFGGVNGIGYVWAEVIKHIYPDGSYTDGYDRFNRIASNGDRIAFSEKYDFCGAPTYHYCVRSAFNGNLITDTDFDPLDGSSWAQGPDRGGFSPQFSGEKTYQESDIIGTSAVHANFEFIGAQKYSDFQSINMPCQLDGAYPLATRAGRQASGCYNFDVWTTTPTP